MAIVSTHNPRLRELRQLSRHGSGRRGEGLFFAEGLLAAREALSSGLPIVTMVVSTDAYASPIGAELVEEGRLRPEIEILEVSPAAFATLSSRNGPQGIAIVGRKRWARLTDLKVGAGDVRLVLAGASDPGNVGSIVRTCRALGIADVVLVDPTTDPYHPGAVRASMGTVCWTRFAEATAEELLAWAHNRGMQLVAVTPAARLAFDEADYARPLAVVLGAEKEGLPVSLAEACDLSVRIPMIPAMDSINLSVAAGIVLYQAGRPWGRHLL